MISAEFKENRRTHFPSFKKCTSYNVMKSGMIAELTV